MYREPHLQSKSDECAIIWHTWYKTKYGEMDYEKAKTLREEWCNCAGELGEMVHQEYLTNPRYEQLRNRPAGRRKPI